MPIVHHPTTLSLGPLEITGFGLAVLAGFAIAQIICQRELWRRGQDKEAAAIPDIVMAALIGTLIGAKSYYVVLTGDPSAFFSRGGFVFWGGFMGAVALCFAFIRYKKLDFLRIADVAGIAIAAGYAVGRTGCWAVGDDYGRPWDGFLATQFPEGAPPSTAAVMSQQFGVIFPPGTSPSEVIAVHPTQLYETVMGFGMFAILWAFRKHTHKAGWLFGLYCVVAGVERFIVEFFRAKDDRFVAGLTVAQVIGLTIILIGVGLMASRRKPA
ncbi:MAG TPA: prolipoprotein diacylglyceryl transferase [Gemmatimonas aurantiaca]|uniref:Phosphatidylglycerol--prolipoprotein diacylglyceryl transferase n=2 Tax=Gemmatimonas aurantiaca TaxID=173480 RepID=C1A600_GEMAT|nr:prolipoprotein diacylglyceryl transferase [Gemmatimonas aurantiaca]BAH37660.1 prolipoprotein diacylglyceryl transferase [Gemmatimonas aurantiaca T-27]HCT58696.1 prolipoprotein diacylglyceryl transferase [Gemmatimonas aurantiaca]